MLAYEKLTKTLRTIYENNMLSQKAPASPGGPQGVLRKSKNGVRKISECEKGKG